MDDAAPKIIRSEPMRTAEDAGKVSQESITMTNKDFDRLWRKMRELDVQIKSPADELIQDILDDLLTTLAHQFEPTD